MTRQMADFERKSAMLVHVTAVARIKLSINKAADAGRMDSPSGSPMCCSWSFRRRCLAISNVVSRLPGDLVRSKFGSI